MPDLPLSSDAFIRRVQARLHRNAPATFAFTSNGNLRRLSAVLFLLGAGSNGEPHLILNKRSRHVRQPGDLCCPGGGVSASIDPFLARGIDLPAMPLRRWPLGSWWRRHREADWPKLALLLAAGLREGFEEMRLNPLGVTFLGPLPAECLIMFERAIYPLAVWVNGQRRFVTNWEVEKIVRIPVSAFFDAGNYARYRVSFESGTPGVPDASNRDLPCFVQRHNGEAELLWGATYRIAVQFLKAVFDYVPPLTESLPVIRRQLDRRYLEGAVRP
jgi:8-oxo-dGTP pyrophosphatase MutT (NUDIX family)